MTGAPKPKGYAVLSDPDVGTVEHDTFTCKHCQRIVEVPHKGTPDQVGGICYQCWGLVCPKCLSDPVCKPFEQKCREMEAQYHALRSYREATMK